MTAINARQQFVNMERASEKAFCAAFFFLPLSKPFMYVALLAAFLLFLGSGRFVAACTSWRTLPWVAPALILSALPFLSLIVHDDPRQAVSNLDLAYYWFFAFGTFLAASQMSIVPWIRAFLWGLLVVFCYAQLPIAGWIGIGSIPSALKNTIFYSQFLAVGIVLLSILYGAETVRNRKVTYLIGMAVFFFGLVSGIGRSGMLALVVLLPLVFANLFSRRNRVKVGLACVLVGVVMLLSHPVQKRISDAVNDIQMFQHHDAQTNIGFRFAMWSAAWDVFRAHPVLGAGPWAFKAEWDNPQRRAGWTNPERANEAKGFVEPHNAFFFFASAYGSIGLAALIWLYGALLWTGWIHRRSLEGNIVLASAVIFILGSFTNTMFRGAASHTWLMLFIGLQGALLHAAAPAQKQPDVPQ